MTSHLVVNNPETALQMTLASAGAAILADMLVGDAVRNGQLVSILKKFHATRPIALSAVYPHGRHRIPKGRVFLDFLIAEFSSAPWKVDTSKRRTVPVAKNKLYPLRTNSQLLFL
jgi:DNA-binding transcriptional LysR family regulator